MQEAGGRAGGFGSLVRQPTRSASRRSEEEAGWDGRPRPGDGGHEDVL